MNAINWFEIVVTDLDRAARFYESTLGIALRREGSPDLPMAIFPYQDPGLGGALIRDGRRAPGAGGSLVYLNANGKLEACLERVARAGGSVITPRTAIGPFGFIASVRATEGNQVGLHAEA